VLTRSHALGNDYLVADPSDLPFAVTPERARLLCDRHFGIGSDGLLLRTGELGVRIFNPDGSEAEKSGNGLRIFARWLFDSGRVSAPRFVIETPSGRAAAEVSGRMVTVDMGVPVFRDDLRQLSIDGQLLEVVAVSVGNPHCVVFRDQLDVTELRWIGPRLEHHPAFPQRTNVQLARVSDRGSLDLLIWERGAGETLASGSSSCAVVAAAHHLGRVGDDVTAHMPGGELRVHVEPAGNLLLSGPVDEVGSIRLSAEMIARLQALP
jgi:diaminopimelate epimerase